MGHGVNSENALISDLILKQSTLSIISGKIALITPVLEEDINDQEELLLTISYWIGVAQAFIEKREMDVCPEMSLEDALKGIDAVSMSFGVNYDVK